MIIHGMPDAEYFQRPELFFMVLGGFAGLFAVLSAVIWGAVYLDTHGSTGWWVFGPFVAIVVIGAAAFLAMDWGT